MSKKVLVYVINTGGPLGNSHLMRSCKLDGKWQKSWKEELEKFGIRSSWTIYFGQIIKI